MIKVMIKKTLFLTLFSSLPMLCLSQAGAAEEQGKFEIETTLESALNFQDNRDLDDDEDDFLSYFDPKLTVEFLYEANSYFEIFTEIEATKRINIEHGDDTSFPSNDEELNLKELYFDVKDLPAEGLTVRAGRQEFEDKREWLYDEELDGIRVFYEQQNWSVELSASRQLSFRENLISDDSYDEHRNYYMAYTSYEPLKGHELNAYTIVVDDREADDTLVHFGMRSSGRFQEQLAYWAELGAVRGQEDNTDVRGYGFDVGATYTFASKFSPALTLAYAFGSGDSDTDDSVDRNFRQTGIQDNTGRFIGVEDFQLYGEALDPELSNIGILTIGAGIRPSPKSSVELIYHHYRQNELVEDEIRNASIRAETAGQSHDIGQGLDIVLGYHEIKNLQLYARYGLFFPGDAFEESADTAHTFQVGFEYEF